jgi:hypothetical protein
VLLHGVKLHPELVVSQLGSWIGLRVGEGLLDLVFENGNLHLSVFLIDGAITPDLVNKSLKILKLALESPIVAYETVEKIDIEDAIVFIGLENHH